MSDSDSTGALDGMATIDQEQRGVLENFWRNYRRNTLSVIGGTIIVSMLVVGVLAPFIAPYNPTTQFDRPAGEYHPLPPGTEVSHETADGEVIEVTYLFGSDHFGRDIFSRWLFGIRILMIIAIGSISWSLLLGATAGAIAGYFNNSNVDDSIMRGMDILFSFPSLILALGVIGIVGTGPTRYNTPFGRVVVPQMAKIIFVTGLVYIPAFARVMRSAVLKETEEEYIMAAKVYGASDARILLKELAVNTLPVVIVQGTLYMGSALLVAAALSFLGLGIQPPSSSLGLMLANSRNYVYTGDWWYSVFPGLGIGLAILGFNLMGDGLRDALDPRYTSEERRT